MCCILEEIGRYPFWRNWGFFLAVQLRPSSDKRVWSILSLWGPSTGRSQINVPPETAQRWHQRPKNHQPPRLRGVHPCWAHPTCEAFRPFQENVSFAKGLQSPPASFGLPSQDGVSHRPQRQLRPRARSVGRSAFFCRILQESCR